MFRATSLRRMAAMPPRGSSSKQLPLNIATNPYKARKVWPPDFKDLNYGQQLRFEKKYKRRILLASRSPRWEKGIKFVQLSTIVFALIYLLFFSEFEWWGQKYKPSEEMRKKVTYVWGVMDPEKRHERRRDAPLPPPPNEPSEPKNEPESK